MSATRHSSDFGKSKLVVKPWPPDTERHAFVEAGATMDQSAPAQKLQETERRIAEVEAALARTVDFIDHLDGADGAAAYLADITARHNDELESLKSLRQVLINKSGDGKAGGE